MQSNWNVEPATNIIKFLPAIKSGKVGNFSKVFYPEPNSNSIFILDIFLCYVQLISIVYLMTECNATTLPIYIHILSLNGIK